MRGNCRQLVEELQLSAQQLARIAKKCPYLLRTVSSGCIRGAHTGCRVGPGAA